MTPILFYWNDDGVMVPRDRFRKLCDKTFVVGETYPLVVEEPRSRASHSHFFAAIDDGWKNLPENIAPEFSTPEHLRKHALIAAGYCDKRTLVCASKAEAVRTAAFIRPMDEYAVITATHAVVTVYTAKSQSVKAMGRKQFQDSKQAVLEIIAGMIGVDVAQLLGNKAA
jgi:hypothetical protein